MDGGACILRHKRDPEKPRRAIDGKLVCVGCLHRLERMIEQAVEDHAALVDRLAPGSVYTERTTGTPERALPIVMAVADHRDTLRRQLVAWSLRVADPNNLIGPLPRARQCGEFLIDWLAWIAAQSWVADLDDKLRTLNTRSRSLLSPAGVRHVDAGPCREVVDETDEGEELHCAGQLTALLYPHPERDSSRLICDTCLLLVPMVKLPDYAKQHEIDLYLDGEVIAFLTGIATTTLRQWATRGHILRCGADPDTGRTRYDLAEVLAHQEKARKPPEKKSKQPAA